MTKNEDIEFRSSTVEVGGVSPGDSNVRDLLGVFLLTLVVYTVFGYGGVRSPDGELMFRTAEALASHGSFAINELEAWPSFGVATGVDGNAYSKYGPMMPVAAAPLVPLGIGLAEIGWWDVMERPPVSHYVDGGLTDVLSGRRPSDGSAHAVRAVVAWFNAIVGALCVVVFCVVLGTQQFDRSTVFSVSLVFAFGSPMLVSSGTFFSEPLATLFMLLGLFSLERERALAGDREKILRDLAAGLWLGAAVATHIAMVTWTPFFLLMAIRRAWKVRRRLSDAAAAGCAFTAGGFVVGVAMGLFNVLRFGQIFSTGRPAADSLFNTPWLGLWGLLFSCGRGLFIYCPITIVAVVGMVAFVRKRPWFATTLLSAVIVRLLFVASFHDWHGGFGLGPRYLLSTVPLLLLPAAYVVQRLQKSSVLVVLLLFFSVSQQVYFASGEIFSYQHRMRLLHAASDLNVFAEDRLYLECDLSPINPVYLVRGTTGPMIGRAFALNPIAVWGLGTLFVAVGVLLLRLVWRRTFRRRW